MPKKPQSPDDRVKQFYDEMRNVKPLKHDEARVTKIWHESKIKSVPKESTRIVQHNHQHQTQDPVRSDTHLSFKHPSISHKTLRNLSKGQYNVDAILDLHGYTVSDAENTLDSFLEDCMRKQCRVVLIIHGKSRASDTPILKNKLNEWLRYINVVLAFCSAQPLHGSRGAMYVLLKRHKEEDTLE